jgi:hypothetical protein
LRCVCVCVRERACIPALRLLLPTPCVCSAKREGFGIKRQLYVTSTLCAVLELVRIILMDDDSEPTGNRGFYLVLYLQYLCAQLYLVVAIVVPGLSSFALCETTSTSDGKYERLSFFVCVCVWWGEDLVCPCVCSQLSGLLVLVMLCRVDLDDPSCKVPLGNKSWCVFLCFRFF